MFKKKEKSKHFARVNSLSVDLKERKLPFTPLKN